jgi:hypothetical protein
MLRVSAPVLLLLCAPAARAEEPQAVYRQLVGIGPSASDSGFGWDAQLGIRISPVLLRLTFGNGGGVGPRGYLLGTFRGDLLFRIGADTMLVAGMGIGGLAYGFVYDDPVGNVGVLTPEIGLLFGADRLFGRILVTLTGLVPTGAVSHERDFAGQAISPPHVMATVVISL